MIPSYVVDKFAAAQAMPLQNALSIFAELEEFLAEASDLARSPTRAVDEAWHTFILHTLDYAAYCEKRFGRFIHHVPTTGVSRNDSQCSTACKDCKSSVKP